MNSNLKTKIHLILSLDQILDEAQQEFDLVPYFVKLIMRERGIPVVMCLTELRNKPFEVEFGKLDWTIDDNLMMEIIYEH